MTTQNTDLAKPENLIPLSEVAARMPALLATATEQLAKATAAVEALPPITDEASKEVAFALQKRIKGAHDTYHEERMPFTRQLAEVTKKFTGLEAGYLALVDKIGKEADIWAKAELAKARTLQAAADAKLQAEQKAIELDGRIRDLLRQRIDAMLNNVRGAAGKMVNEVTKENHAETKTRLGTEPRWVPEKMDDYYYELPSWVTDTGRFAAIAEAEKQINVGNYCTGAKQILNESLAILDVALHSQEEAKRLQAIAAQAAAEEQKATADAAQRDIDAQKAIAGFDKEVVEAPKVRTKMKIEVLEEEAWVQIFAHWWKFDTDKPDDLGKKTLLQMKTFCEKDANTNNRFIEHPSLQYIEDVKAK